MSAGTERGAGRRLYEVAGRYFRRGLGMRFTRSRFLRYGPSEPCFWTITTIKPGRSGRDPVLRGKLTWRGLEEEMERVVPRAAKQEWRVFPRVAEEHQRIALQIRANQERDEKEKATKAAEELYKARAK